MSRAQACAEFFKAALAAFGRTPHQQSYRGQMGGIPIEVITGGALSQQDLLSPLAWSSGMGEPLARILAWDDSLEPSGMPGPPWGAHYVYTRRGDVRGYQDLGYQFAYNYEARLLTAWDPQRRLGIYWTPRADSLPGYERSAPMRTLWHWLGWERDWQLTHAAAVGLPGGGVLLAGKGGSGKSTTAVACWQGGLDYLGDDYCWLGSESGPSAHAVYCSARLHDASLDRLSPLEIQPRWCHDKQALRIDSGAVPSMPIRAVLLPQVVGHGPRLRESTREEGLSALALTTVGQLAGAGASTVERLERFVADLPVYVLELGPEVARIAPLLRELLGERG